MKKYLMCFIFCFATLVCAETIKIGDTITGNVWVIDGDSIRLTLENYHKAEIRIFGIDAPEYDTQSGKSATWFLVNTVKTSKRKATCLVIDIDRYHRYVSQCHLHTNTKHIDIGEYMLRNGHAKYYGKYMGLPSVPNGLKARYKNARP